MGNKKGIDRVVIFGNGEMAYLAYFYFKHDTDLDVASFTFDRAYRGKDEFEGIELVDFEEVVKKSRLKNI